MSADVPAAGVAGFFLIALAAEETLIFIPHHVVHRAGLEVLDEFDEPVEDRHVDGVFHPAGTMVSLVFGQAQNLVQELGQGLVTLDHIQGDALTRISQGNPILHKDLMTRWQKALTDADAWLTQLSTGSAKKRMANLLLRLLDDGGSECHLFSREDIGSILSITVETASRTISEFKRLGLITEIRSNHFDLDIAGLNKIIKA